MERGAIHKRFDSPAAAVLDSDLVILCTPVGIFGDMLGKISGSLKPGAIVTDVGSTKRSIVELARKHLPHGVHFVGSHPMAGGEKQGMPNARADLLTDATCILTPTESTDPGALATVDWFWKQLKMQTLQLSPGEHDRQVADISHLPHAVAAAMVRIQTTDALKLAARGFADSTRIAAGDSGLWRDIFLDNRDNVKAGIQRLQTELAELTRRLDAGDETAVRDWLVTAADIRKDLGRRDL